MPGKGNMPKLSVDMQREVCVWIAEGWGSERIAQEIKDLYNIDISRQAIHNFYMKNKKFQSLIQRLRTQLDKDILKHPLAVKKNRLEILRRAIEEAFMWRTDKVVYDKAGKEIARVEKRQIAAIAALIREARVEVEGDKIEGATGPTTNNIVLVMVKPGEKIPKELQEKAIDVEKGDE